MFSHNALDIFTLHSIHLHRQFRLDYRLRHQTKNGPIHLNKTVRILPVSIMGSRILSYFSDMLATVRQITSCQSNIFFSLEMVDEADMTKVVAHNMNHGGLVHLWQNLYHLVCVGCDIKLESPAASTDSAKAGAKKRLYQPATTNANKDKEPAPPATACAKTDKGKRAKK